MAQERGFATDQEEDVGGNDKHGAGYPVPSLSLTPLLVRGLLPLSFLFAGEWSNPAVAKGCTQLLWQFWIDSLPKKREAKPHSPCHRAGSLYRSSVL